MMKEVRMETFRTINKSGVAEIVEKKSKFIAHIFYIETKEEAQSMNQR